jgi:hypothetical protein
MEHGETIDLCGKEMGFCAKGRDINVRNKWNKEDAT